MNTLDQKKNGWILKNHNYLIYVGPIQMKLTLLPHAHIAPNNSQNLPSSQPFFHQWTIILHHQKQSIASLIFFWPNTVEEPAPPTSSSILDNISIFSIDLRTQSLIVILSLWKSRTITKIKRGQGVFGTWFLVLNSLLGGKVEEQIGISNIRS